MPMDVSQRNRCRMSGYDLRRYLRYNPGRTAILVLIEDRRAVFGAMGTERASSPDSLVASAAFRSHHRER
jgi:hypothetical protein